MKKVLNRLAYFFNDYDNYVGITIITLVGEYIIGTIYALMDFSKNGSRNQFDDNMFILVLVAVLTKVAIMIFRQIFNGIILSDFKKSTRQTTYKVLDYTDKTVYKGDNGTKYYEINIDGIGTKIIKADKVSINRKYRTSIGAESSKTEFVEVEFDKNLPEYKEKSFKEHMSDKGYDKLKHQLNITYYVPNQAAKKRKAFYEPYEPTRNKESSDDTLKMFFVFYMVAFAIIFTTIMICVFAML